MNRGCLYWDESSRGTKAGKPDRRGRWCAEKNINGRMVRMRSGDINRCLAFLNNAQPKPTLPEGVVEIKGFPGYYIHPDTADVYSTHRGLSKISVQINHSSPCVILWCNGRRQRLSLYRLLYAVRMDIRYSQIPNDLHVRRYDDGSLRLCNRSDIGVSNCDAANHHRVAEREKMLERKRNEADIMLQYYQTHDAAPVIEYIFSLRSSCVIKVERKYFISTSRAEYLVDAATEMLIRHIMDSETRISDLKYTLIGFVKKIRRENRMKELYVE